MYGIYNTWRKQWQFGICEPSEEKAWQALYDKIGKDAYKWRFEVRIIPYNILETMRAEHEVYKASKARRKKEQDAWRAERHKRREKKELDNMILKKNVGRGAASVKPIPKSFVVIDFETSGFNPNVDRIIELGAVRYTDGEPVAILNFMVNQDITALDPMITEVTGHTLEDVKKGMGERFAIQLLMDFIDQIYGEFYENPVIVGQNILFDYEFYRRAVQRHWGFITRGYVSSADYEVAHDLYDTLTIARDRKPYPHKLANLCQYYGVEQQNWHSAYFDCLATGDVFLAMHKEDSIYPEVKQVADYVNVIGYRRQYGEPAWKPDWVTLKPQGNITINENK